MGNTEAYRINDLVLDKIHDMSNDENEAEFIKKLIDVEVQWSDSKAAAPFRERYPRLLQEHYPFQQEGNDNE